MEDFSYLFPGGISVPDAVAGLAGYVIGATITAMAVINFSKRRIVINDLVLRLLFGVVCLALSLHFYFNGVFLGSRLDPWSYVGLVVALATLIVIGIVSLLAMAEDYLDEMEKGKITQLASLA